MKIRWFEIEEIIIISEYLGKVCENICIYITMYEVKKKTLIKGKKGKK